MTPDAQSIAAIIGAQATILKSIKPLTKAIIARRFRNGDSLRALAGVFLPEHEMGVATGVINDLLRAEIPADEYAELVIGKGPRSQIREAIGIHSQSSEEKARLGREGATAAGGNPYSEEEETRLLSLITLQENRYGTRVNAARVAGILNREFHGDKIVRNSSTVRQKICSLRKKTAARVGETLEK